LSGTSLNGSELTIELARPKDAKDKKTDEKAAGGSKDEKGLHSHSSICLCILLKLFIFFLFKYSVIIINY